MDLPCLKVHLARGAQIPQAMTPGSAACDIFACLDADLECFLKPFDRLPIPTGLRFEIPSGYFLSIRPRSGLALHKGFVLPNAPATIDTDFRGELKILAMNIDPKEAIVIKGGDRIAQLLLEKKHFFSFQKVEDPTLDLNMTERGEKGFGSTGYA